MAPESARNDIRLLRLIRTEAALLMQISTVFRAIYFSEALYV